MTLVSDQPAATLADVPTPDLIDELRRRDPGAVVLPGEEYARRLDVAWSAGWAERDADEDEGDEDR